MRDAARRVTVIFAALAGGTGLLALLIGVLAGSGIGRALSVGWYSVGSLLLISGFFVGNRGPARPHGEGWSAFSLQRWVRWASPEEQRESISFSALLVVLGIVLIVLGAIADTRYAIV